LPAIATRLLESGPASIARAAVRDRWAGLPASRRRAVLALGAAGIALVVALAVIPPPGAPATQTAGVENPAPAVTDVAGTDATEITGDDPVAALHELASRRDGCFRELSVLCLDGVDEAASSAWDSDRAAIQAILDGGKPPHRLHTAGATLVERIGGSALVALAPDGDSSVLLQEGRAGWRIRDYLERPGGADEAIG
jgi:hypothetical protein